MISKYFVGSISKLKFNPWGFYKIAFHVQPSNQNISNENEIVKRLNSTFTNIGLHPFFIRTSPPNVLNAFKKAFFGSEIQLALPQRNKRNKMKRFN